ncbi:Hypp6725 [Branchiostoma lanceolatum]|uniref:Hypp6725 protein n=1 Tax=Branchiostoma lanceolatum TaxID=7740 RepID=A0A8J9YVH0_BRALA|nr:Hypp6725 [Branchiostoma lanceolatum]
MPEKPVKLGKARKVIKLQIKGAMKEKKLLLRRKQRQSVKKVMKLLLRRNQRQRPKKRGRVAVNQKITEDSESEESSEDDESDEEIQS